MTPKMGKISKMAPPGPWVAPGTKLDMAYYIPMEHADKKAPGKDATPKWSEVIPNTLVKLVFFNKIFLPSLYLYLTHISFLL